MAYAAGLALAARAQSFNLLAALGLVLANMLLLEPKATKVSSISFTVLPILHRFRVAEIVPHMFMWCSRGWRWRRKKEGDRTGWHCGPTSRHCSHDGAAAAARAETCAKRTPVTGKAATPATGQAMVMTGDVEMSKSRMLKLNTRLKM
jgi:hypothetical protein